METIEFVKSFRCSFLALAEIFQREFAEDTMALYLKALQGFGLSREQILKAMEKAFAECTSFPKPAEIIKLSKGDGNDKATLQGYEVLKQVNQLGSYGKPNFKDPITARIMDKKWKDFCQSHLTKNDSFFVRDFIRQYMAIKSDEMFRKPAIEASQAIKQITENIG